MFEFITDLFKNITMFEVFAVLFILVILFFYIYKNTRSKANDVLAILTPLHTKKDIVTADVVQNTLLGSSGSTVMGFFNLQDGNRTVTLGNDYTSLLFVDNNWWLEIAHTPSTTSARLRIQTNDAGQIKQEILELPSIPKQKWIFIAILREGRRFDVIYDNRIVASKLLDNYPVIISSPLSIGNSKLLGKTNHIIINPTRLTPNEVERQRAVYVNTNNQVLEDNPIIDALPTIKLVAECPSGLPCNNITSPPKNKMFEWSTPYA